MNLRLTGFQKLALASVIATWIMVVIGVIVRSTGSGMGCPDWPLCHGQVIPPIGDTAAWLESIHRWWGVIIGFLVLGLIVSAFRTQRATRSVVVGSVVALGIVGFQAYLGKVTVDMNNSAETVLAHLATAMILLGVFLFVLIRSRFPAVLPARGASLRIPLLVGFAAISVFTVLLFGAETTCPGVDRGAAGCAALIFPEWPLFDGQLIPVFSDDPTLSNLQMRQFSHRIVAAITAVIVLVTTVVVWRAVRRRETDGEVPGAETMLGLVGTAAALYAVQIVVGALQIWTTLEPWAVSLHLSLGSLIWALMLSAALYGWYSARATVAQPLQSTAAAPEDAAVGEHAPEAPGAAGAGISHAVSATPSGLAITRRDKVRAYIALTKPRIIELLLVTTVPAMVLAWRFTDGLDPATFAWLVIATLIGGSLAAGAANAINNYIDRDIDQLMIRTQRRPLPAHAIAPEDALMFGLILTVISFTWLAFTTNLVAAFLTLLAVAFYVVDLHHGAEADDAAEHRHRWCGRCAATAHRLGCGHRRHLPAGAVPLRHRLLLDATPLLGAGAADPWRLRGGRRAHAAGDPRRARDHPPDRPLHRADGGHHAGLLRCRPDGPALPRRRAGAGRPVPVPGLRHGPRRDRCPRGAHLQVLDHLPDGAVRADHPRRRRLHPALVPPGVGAGRVSAALLWLLLAGLVLSAVTACEPTLRQQTGIVVGVDSPGLGRVDSFRLLTTDGETLTFDTSSLEFRAEFPAPHLAEHQVIGDLIVVTYRQEGERLVVTQLDDSGGPGH